MPPTPQSPIPRMASASEATIRSMSSAPRPVDGQRPLDPVDVVDAQEQPARTAEEVAELLDGRADGRGVDDRQHLVDVLADELVEEHLVAVVQVGEEDPLVDVGLAGAGTARSERATCSSIVSVPCGSRPCSPRWSRSANVNAVPRLTWGSSRTSRPRAWICTCRDPSGSVPIVNFLDAMGASSRCALRADAPQDHTRRCSNITCIK